MIESYDYGWTVQEIDSTTKYFYSNIASLLRSLVDMKLKKSSSKSIQELKDSIDVINVKIEAMCSSVKTNVT